MGDPDQYTCDGDCSTCFKFPQKNYFIKMEALFVALSTVVICLSKTFDIGEVNHSMKKKRKHLCVKYIPCTRTLLICGLVFVFLYGRIFACHAFSIEEKNVTQRLSKSFVTDMEKTINEGTAREIQSLQPQTSSLFEREPLGFDFKTIERLWQWVLTLPSRFPTVMGRVVEHGRLLGFAGSLVVLTFLLAVVYSMVGQKKILLSLERAAQPLRSLVPEGFYPYAISLLKIIVASLMPLILFGLYGLIYAFIYYRSPWFLLVGKLLKLWALGALLINLLREFLTRDLFMIPSHYGLSIFRAVRISILYILFSIGVFWGAKAFQMPDEFLALLKFLLSLSIVCMLLFLLLKKKAILGILPKLPYRSYQLFLSGLERFYKPAIFFTFLTGLLWSLGYKILSKILWKKTWAIAGAFLGIILCYHLLQSWLRKWIEKKDITDEAARFFYRAIHSLLVYAAVMAVAMTSLSLLGLFLPLQRLMAFPLINIGQTSLSLWTFLKVAFILLAFILVSRLFRAWLDYRIYPSAGVEEGLAYAINTFINYFLLVIGFLFSLSVVGLDLRVLVVFAGAAGIGIGFGLQNTAANLTSGLSLVFGRRIRKGDWIQVGNTLGSVREVGLGATKVRTRDNLEYLIPNSQLTSNTIINYSLSDPLIRMHVPVGVSYSSNPKEVERILLDVAAGNSNLNKQKQPVVWFSEYADSSLNFELLVWIDVRKVSEANVRSELYFTIFQAFQKSGISIPFPQRDLHIRSGPSWADMQK